MIPSPFGTIGPFFPSEFSDGTNDLTHHNGKTAQGRHIVITGSVLEEGGKPTFNTIVEIWQPDAHGIFRHPLDPQSENADPGFAGWGRARTDADGRYEFRTVLPGSYDGRLPHINIMILAIGLTRRLVTTIFFDDGPDPVLDCVDAGRKSRLVARENQGTFHFDVILRGENETPFFLD